MKISDTILEVKENCYINVSRKNVYICIIRLTSTNLQKNFLKIYFSNQFFFLGVV